MGLTRNKRHDLYKPVNIVSGLWESINATIIITKVTTIITIITIITILRPEGRYETRSITVPHIERTKPNGPGIQGIILT